MLFVRLILVTLLGIFFFCRQTVMLEELNNSQVVKALKEGDPSAFEAVYKAYCCPLRTYATNILRDADAAYEVVQDTFMAVWLNRQKLDVNKSLRHYLLRAVHNNSLRLLQMEESRKVREKGAVWEWRQMSGESPEMLHKREALVPSIERLPEQSKKVLRMTYWEDKKSATIAEELSISVRTVETILYKVKKKLRGEIEKIILFL